MKRILVFLFLLATFASAQQADSTDILIYIGKKDTTQTGRWRSGMPVRIRDSWDRWGERERLSNKFVIVRVGVEKSRIDSFLVAHSDSSTGLRRKYQLSRAAIQFVKNNRDENNVVRVTPAQLRNAFKRANRLRRFGEPQKMNVLPIDLFVRWRNMLVAPTLVSVTVNTDGGGDYTSLVAAEAGEQDDLVSANKKLKINCSGTTADVAAVIFAGWGTDATRYYEVVGDNQTGRWSTAHYRLSISSVVGGGVIASDENNQTGRFRNLQIAFVSNSSYSQGFRFRGSGSTRYIESCIIKSSGGSSNRSGVYLQASTLFIKNTIIDSCNYGVVGELFANLNAYNNTVRGAVTAYWRITSGTFVAKNNLNQNCIDGYNGTIEGDYNLSDIASDAPGEHSLNETSVNFTDAENGDFSFAAGSAGIDQGTNLFAEGVTTDIKGVNRPQGAAFDIGAFEFTVSNSTQPERRNGFNGWLRNGFKGRY